MALEKTGQDVLGPISAALSLPTKTGQVWTPHTISYMMAKMVIGGPDEKGQLAKTIRQYGFIDVSEPACGPGGMILAFAQAFNEAGYNSQRQLHVTAQDIAPWCCHMTMVQCSLMGIPATVLLGNSLSNEAPREVWYTPMYIMHGFSRRLRQRREDEAGREPISTEAAIAPQPLFPLEAVLEAALPRLRQAPPMRLRDLSQIGTPPHTVVETLPEGRP